MFQDKKFGPEYVVFPLTKSYRTHTNLSNVHTDIHTIINANSLHVNFMW